MILGTTTPDLYEELDIKKIQYDDLDEIERELIKNSVQFCDVEYHISSGINNLMQRTRNTNYKYSLIEPDDYIIQADDISGRGYNFNRSYFER